MESRLLAFPATPHSPHLGRSLRTIAALWCRKETQCAWKKARPILSQRKGRVFHGSDDAATATAIATVLMVDVHTRTHDDGDATRGFGMIDQTDRPLVDQTSAVGIT